MFESHLGLQVHIQHPQNAVLDVSEQERQARGAAEDICFLREFKDPRRGRSKCGRTEKENLDLKGTLRASFSYTEIPPAPTDKTMPVPALDQPENSIWPTAKHRPHVSRLPGLRSPSWSHPTSSNAQVWTQLLEWISTSEMPLLCPRG